MKAYSLVFVTAAAIVPLGGPRAQIAPLTATAITPEQRTAIHKHIVEEKRRSVAAPLGFLPAVGATIPQGIELFWMPPGAGVNRYRYTVVGNRALIVDPEGRQIIELVE